MHQVTFAAGATPYYAELLNYTLPPFSFSSIPTSCKKIIMIAYTNHPPSVITLMKIWLQRLSLLLFSQLR